MMKTVAVAAVSAVCMIASAHAQTATAVGTGIAVSRSASHSTATAISGQGGTGVGTVNVNNTPATPAVTPAVTVNQTTPATQTIRNVPTEFAPGLAAAGLETCLGSVSGGGAFVGTGFSFGTTIPDPGCAARLDARTLWSFGLKKAALARLCLMPDIYRSMPEVCYQYLPQPPAQQAQFREAYATPAEYTGGPVEVIVAKTGEHRTCNDYDVNKRRCRAWAQ